MTDTKLSRRWLLSRLAAVAAIPALAACARNGSAGDAPGPLLQSNADACTGPSFNEKDADQCRRNPQVFTRPGNVPAPYAVAYGGNDRIGTIIINNATRKLYYIQDSQRAVVYTIGIGDRNTRIPPGAEFGIIGWAVWPSVNTGGQRYAGDINSPTGARVLSFANEDGSKGYSIHGTNEPWALQRDEPHASIRMFNPDVIDLYQRAPDGAKVTVIDDAFFNPRNTAGGPFRIFGFS